MSKMWTTPLRDTLPNRHNSSVPELQCGGHRSEDLYVTSPTASASTDKIPRKKTLRDHSDFDRRLCGADHEQKTKNWTDDLTDARNWLIRQLGAFPGDRYFAGIFDHKEKRSVFKEKGR